MWIILFVFHYVGVLDHQKVFKVLSAEKHLLVKVRLLNSIVYISKIFEIFHNRLHVPSTDQMPRNASAAHLIRVTFSSITRPISEDRRLVLVLVLILGISHHQADACHLASVYLGFRSIWNKHFCLRLQPHLYPSLVGTSLGRDVRPNSDISQRMSSPTPPSETRNYC